MATSRYIHLDYTNVNNNAPKNIALLFAVMALGFGCGLASSKFLSTSSWESLLKESWIIQGVLVAAIVALIYKLQSDIAGLAGLTAMQRAQLDSMVTVKSRRLWALFFTIALSALLPRIATAMPEGVMQNRVLFLATFLQTVSTLLCFHLPGMWQELRRFTTAMIAEKERKARQQAELDRLTKAAE